MQKPVRQVMEKVVYQDVPVQVAKIVEREVLSQVCSSRIGSLYAPTALLRHVRYSPSIA